MTDEEKRERDEWQAQFLRNQQEMISATVSRLLAEERAAGKDGGFACRWCPAPATWYSYGVGACREHTPRAVELLTVQGRIDRACRVVQALSTSALANKRTGHREDTLDFESEWGESEDEIVDLRDRERELLARPVDGRVSVAAAVDAIEEARAEGIAQGRLCNPTIQQCADHLREKAEKLPCA